MLYRLKGKNIGQNARPASIFQGYTAKFYFYSDTEMCNTKSNIFSFDSMLVTALMSLESMAGRLLYYFQCADMHTPVLSSR